MADLSPPSGIYASTYILYSILNSAPDPGSLEGAQFVGELLPLLMILVSGIPIYIFAFPHTIFECPFSNQFSDFSTHIYSYYFYSLTMIGYWTNILYIYIYIVRELT